MSEFWEEQLSSMPFMSCKYSLLASLFIMNFEHREKREDFAPTQGQIQADSLDEEEEKDRNLGHLRPIQGEQEEAGTIEQYGPICEHTELGPWSPAAPQLRSYRSNLDGSRSKGQGCQNEFEMNVKFIYLSLITLRVD